MPELTLLVTTAPIPSHPDTRLIEFVVRCFRAYPEMKEVPILIACDGVHPTLRHRTGQYAEYKQNLHKLCKTTWHNVQVVEFPEHLHASGVTRRALESVKTPLCFYTGHGWCLHGPIEWSGLLDAMQVANSIRFYIFDDIHPDHKHLFKERTTIRGVPLMPTIQYADGPTIYKTDWLKGVIQQYVHPNTKAFNEDILWPVFHNKGWEGWEQMYVYAPPRMNRNVWFNEREDDPTPERIYETLHY